MSVDLFPRTDKVKKLLEKPVDMFPYMDEGLRRTSYQLVPCGDGMFAHKGEG